jgi:hypothetical membrane protein
MSKRKKVHFFFRYFLSALFAVLIGVYFKVNQHPHADMVLAIALTYALVILTSVVVYKLRSRRSAKLRR